MNNLDSVSSCEHLGNTCGVSGRTTDVEGPNARDDGLIAVTRLSSTLKGLTNLNCISTCTHLDNFAHQTACQRSLKVIVNRQEIRIYARQSLDEFVPIYFKFIIKAKLKTDFTHQFRVYGLIRCWMNLRPIEAILKMKFRVCWFPRACWSSQNLTPNLNTHSPPSPIPQTVNSWQPHLHSQILLHPHELFVTVLRLLDKKNFQLPWHAILALISDIQLQSTTISTLDSVTGRTYAHFQCNNRLSAWSPVPDHTHLPAPRKINCMEYRVSSFLSRSRSACALPWFQCWLRGSGH